MINFISNEMRHSDTMSSTGISISNALFILISTAIFYFNLKTEKHCDDSNMLYMNIGKAVIFCFVLSALFPVLSYILYSFIWYGVLPFIRYILLPSGVSGSVYVVIVDIFKTHHLSVLAMLSFVISYRLVLQSTTFLINIWWRFSIYLSQDFSASADIMLAVLIPFLGSALTSALLFEMLVKKVLFNVVIRSFLVLIWFVTSFYCVFNLIVQAQTILYQREVV